MSLSDRHDVTKDLLGATAHGDRPPDLLNVPPQVSSETPPPSQLSGQLSSAAHDDRPPVLGLQIFTCGQSSDLSRPCKIIAWAVSTMALQCLVHLLLLPSVVPQYVGMEVYPDLDLWGYEAQYQDLLGVGGSGDMLEVIWAGTPHLNTGDWNEKLPEIGYIDIPHEESPAVTEEEDHGATEKGHEESAPGPLWEHTGSLGPEFWGSINHNCLGSRQSPINMDNTIVVRENTKGRGVEFCNYEQANAKTTLLENNGHTVELKLLNPPAQPSMTGGHLQSNYSMAQLHFHWAPTDDMGSEHTVDKMVYPLEMHLVHLASDIAMDQMGGLAVAGFFFQISMEDNPEMEAIIERVPVIQHEHQETQLTDINFNVMKLIQDSQSGPYYSYAGSLTTPGCDEVVQWVLYSNPLNISSRQLAVFRTILDHNGNPLLQNFRPVQPLNGRTVVLHTPSISR